MRNLRNQISVRICIESALLSSHGFNFKIYGKGKTVHREVKLRIPEEVVQQVERIEGKSIEDVLQTIWGQYLKDGRRTAIETKKLPISWPLDWYARMQTTWGQKELPNKIRELIYKELNTEKNRPLTPPPEWTEGTGDKVATNPKPLPDRQSYNQAILIPMDWYTRLLERVGDGWASTFVKYLVWCDLNTARRPLSVPPRLSRFM